MNLRKRLNFIISMVPQCDTVADIGTDHGFVPISLVESGKARQAIASDVVKGPVQRAKAHVSQHGLAEKIAVRLGSGLSTLKVGEADCIVICGMGGMLIADILRADFEIAKSAKTLILSPHTEIPALREYLSTNGFSIQDEQMVEEDEKYYTVMRVAFAGADAKTLSERELQFGPALLKERSEIFLSYLNVQKEKTEKILQGLLEAAEKDGASEHIATAIKEKKEELAEIVTILNEAI